MSASAAANLFALNISRHESVPSVQKEGDEATYMFSGSESPKDGRVLSPRVYAQPEVPESPSPRARDSFESHLEHSSVEEDDQAWCTGSPRVTTECFYNGKRCFIEVNDVCVCVSQATATYAAPVLRVPLDELAGVSRRAAFQQTMNKLCGGNDSPSLVLCTFKRRQFDWTPIEYSIEFDSEKVAECWAEQVQVALDQQPDRPRRLFVVINPYGGHKRADIVWRDIAKPIFDRAHITSDAFRTGFQDHAVQLIEQMSWEEFKAYDGVVAVGGDGLFQECLRGVLALRARGDAWREKARKLRIAQVPAGSTDAVACTINGSRSAHTAALHVVLGDRSKLDVLEVRTREGELRYACSTASYGFIGDVLGRSERMRWMGPARYDVGGALSFLRLRSHPVRLWYKPTAVPHPVRKVCCSRCDVCSRPTHHAFDCPMPLSVAEASTGASSTAGAGDVGGDAGSGPLVPSMPSTELPPLESPRRAVKRGMHMRGASGFGEAGVFGNVNLLKGRSALPTLPMPTDTSEDGEAESQPASSDTWFGDLDAVVNENDFCGEDDVDPGRWRCWEGEVSSLMVVVTPTRSDKSKHGIVPFAHLSDGRLHLVIVRKCTRLQFFRFLISLTRGGVDESLDFVEVKEVEAWRLEELSDCKTDPEPSLWNVDGELMRTAFMSARVHHGLVETFGRGPEVHI